MKVLFITSLGKTIVKDCPVVPNVGDTICREGVFWKVKMRFFYPDDNFWKWVSIQSGKEISFPDFDCILTLD